MSCAHALRPPVLCPGRVPPPVPLGVLPQGGDGCPAAPGSSQLPPQLGGTGRNAPTVSGAGPPVRLP